VRIGVDLGGTKIEGVVLDAGGLVVARHRRPTPSESAAAIVKAVAETVAALEEEVGEPCTVGIGTPGAISPATGRMKNSNTTCLNGEPLVELFDQALGRRVRMANDANCFTLSEASDGAAADARVVFGVIIGTGTGGGLVVDGRVLVGPNAIAGEWGHNPLPWVGPADQPLPACYCGKEGCLETYLSGPGMTRDHLARTGQKRTARDIAAAAGNGSEEARATLDAYVDRLARGLASVINVVDPDAIVLGGGLSRIGYLYDVLPARLDAWVFSDSVRTVVTPPRHGDASGVRGAAWLWEAGHDDR
jgi:fructokinase